MANPQPDQFTRISSEYLEARMQDEPIASGIRSWVERNTWGWDCKAVAYSWPEIAEAIGKDRGNVSREGKRLIESGRLFEPQPGYLSIQKDYEKWQGFDSSKVVRRACAKPHEGLCETAQDCAKPHENGAKPHETVRNRTDACAKPHQICAKKLQIDAKPHHSTVEPTDNRTFTERGELRVLHARVNKSQPATPPPSEGQDGEGEPTLQEPPIRRAPQPLAGVPNLDPAHPNLTMNIPPTNLRFFGPGKPGGMRSTGNALAPFATYDHLGEYNRETDLCAGCWDESRTRWAAPHPIAGLLPHGRPDTIRERGLLGHPEFHPSDHPDWRTTDFDEQAQAGADWRQANGEAMRLAYEWAIGPWNRTVEREAVEAAAKRKIPAAVAARPVEPDILDDPEPVAPEPAAVEPMPEVPAAPAIDRVSRARARAQRQARAVLGEACA